jgi:hypothetical protein
VEIILKANKGCFSRKDFIELLARYDNDRGKVTKLYHDFEQFALQNTIF